jgi:hypothetical protein
VAANAQSAAIRIERSAAEEGVEAGLGAIRQAVVMTDAALVSLADLRRGLFILLEAVERQYGAVVDLDADYYWTVGPQDAFRFEASGVPEPTAGQLTDDIDSLRDMLAGEADRPLVVWHDMAHVIGILNRLAALDQGPAK